MARNLSRNTELFISTLPPASISTSNCVGTQAALGSDNTWKVKVLDGYSFSQDTATQEVGVSEAASECAGVAGLARGTLSFNTALNPVDVSFSVYVRPTNVAGTQPYCVELPIWVGALGNQAALTASPDTGSAGATFNQAVGATDSITFTTEQSDVNELLLLYLYFVLDSTTYVVNEFTVGSIEADFSIDGIATLNITGSGTSIEENPSNVHAELNTTDGNLVAGTHYVDVPTTTSASFLRNKLGTLELVDNKGSATGDDSDTVSGTPSNGVVTLTTGLANYTTADDYAGGRIRNTTSSPDEWAQIIANNGTTSVTVAPADATLVATWSNTDNVELYLPTTHSETIFCIPITGGTLTLENNMSYLTPEELAIVNQPLAGFTGNRLISGSFTAYLNTGAQGSGGLLQDLLAKITEVNNDFLLKFHMGNATTAVPRVDFIIPHAQVSIPTTNVEDVISTEISFVAKSWDASTDAQTFEGANEMTIAYVLDQP